MIKKKYDMNIILLNLAVFLRGILLLSPVVLLFYQENGLGVRDLFFFQGIFYLVSILVEVPIGYVSDFFSKRNVFAFSLLTFMTIPVIWYFFHGFWVILAGEVIFAVSKVLMDTSTSGCLYDYLKTTRNEAGMVKYYSYQNFYAAAGTAAASLLGVFLYIHCGSKTLLGVWFVLIAAAFAALLAVSDVPSEKNVGRSFKAISNDFRQIFNNTVRNKDLKYHILYSGLLVSMSILFSTSFQPLMQNAMFPVFLFGAVDFINHGSRALASAVSGKITIRIDTLGRFMYFAYLLAFGLVFVICAHKNIVVDMVLLCLICLFIGIQVIYTIIHVSRLHRMVSSDYRSAATSVNSLVSRTLTAIILMSSKFFINEAGLVPLFSIYLVIFAAAALYFVTKVSKYGLK